MRWVRVNCWWSADGLHDGQPALRLGLSSRRFELDRRDISQRRMKPLVVKPRDPFHRCQLDRLDGIPRAPTPDHLSLVKTIHCFGEGVVVGLSGQYGHRSLRDRSRVGPGQLVLRRLEVSSLRSRSSCWRTRSARASSPVRSGEPRVSRTVICGSPYAARVSSR